jgi:hypothetical protein
VRRVRDGGGTSWERCREGDSSSRVPPGSRERGRPNVRMPDPRSTAVLRASAKVTGSAQKLPEARRSRHFRHRLTTQPFAVERKSLYAGLSHHGRGDRRPDRPGTFTEVRLRAVPASPGPRKSDFVTSLRPDTHEPLTSRASRGGHSQPGSPRDARDAPRTAAPSSKDAVHGTASRTAAPAANPPPTQNRAQTAAPAANPAAHPRTAPRTTRRPHRPHPFAPLCAVRG